MSDIPLFDLTADGKYRLAYDRRQWILHVCDRHGERIKVFGQGAARLFSPHPGNPPSYVRHHVAQASSHGSVF